ncbi:MAG TPA: ribonuclease HI family protein [Patescibacteria group bacterium]|nr:ribonuclease HI family protein [Patescibacteria group bacterium]
MNFNDNNIIEIFSDGGARGNPGPAASAFVVFQNMNVIFSFSKSIGANTNNWAEYYAVYLALLWLSKFVRKNKITRVDYFLDSELVVNQLTGNYKVKSENLKKLYNKIKTLEKHLGTQIIYKHIRREKNSYADKLVNAALDENS